MLTDKENVGLQSAIDVSESFDESSLCASNLTSLSLSMNDSITNRTIRSLPFITDLDLSANITIYQQLPVSLRRLDLSSNDIYTDDMISHLSNLEYLSLYNNDLVTDNVLSTLVSLTSLCIHTNMVITDAGVSTLTNLTMIDLRCNTKVSAECIKKMNIPYVMFGDYVIHGIPPQFVG